MTQPSGPVTRPDGPLALGSGSAEAALAGESVLVTLRRLAPWSALIVAAVACVWGVVALSLR